MNENLIKALHSANFLADDIRALRDAHATDPALQMLLSDIMWQAVEIKNRLGRVRPLLQTEQK